MKKGMDVWMMGGNKKNKIVGMLFLFLIVLFMAGYKGKDNNNFSSDKKIVLIDVRDSKEYDKSHLKNAINMEVGDLEKNIKTIADKETTILLYCADGCSLNLDGKQILEEMGYQNVSAIETVQEVKENELETEELEETYNTITMENAREVLESRAVDILLIDVRTKEEFKEKKLPNAINIPLDSLPEQVEDYCTDYEKTIYVYCKSGERSKEAVKLLRSMGYVNTFNIGSIQDWK